MTEVVLPSCVPTAPDVTHILDDIFTLCRIPFVHDFIFTADPVADISILTAPVQKEHAIAARITVSGTESTASYAHVFDFSCDYFFCSIPAFSVGAITVGFAIIEPARDSNHPALNQIPHVDEPVQCTRYVRDDDRGVFLMIFENTRTGVTEFDCMSHRSTRKRIRVNARFHTDTLRKRLRSPEGVMLPDKVAQALTYLNVSYERRACPICKRADYGECGCTLPFCRPAHPLDFRNEVQNMRLHTGLYEGESTVRLFNASLPFVITSLTTRSVIQGSLDANVISRLNRYAVQDRMTLLKSSPLAQVICAADRQPEGKERNNNENERVCQVVGNEADFANVSMPDESFLQSSGGLKSPGLSSFSLGGIVDGPIPLMCGPVGVGTTLMDTLEPEKIGNLQSPPSTKHSESDLGVDELMSGEEYQGGSSSGGENTERGDESVPVRRAVRLAARSSGSSEESGGAQKMDPKQVKAELRKQRNREAAARSNIKRKIRNEALRKDLKEIHEKAEELRAREKVLREENVQLRMQATQKNFNISSHLQHIQIARS